MPLEVTVAARNRMLCTLASVKAEIPGLSGSAQDDKITRLIISASGYVARLLGRAPWLQTYTWRTPANGGPYLLAPVWPIKADPTSITLGTGSSPSTVDATTYSVTGERRDRFYRATEWNRTTVLENAPLVGQQLPEYTVNGLAAGWVMPDQLTAWPASTAVTAGAWYKASDSDFPFIFEVTTAGTTGSTEPAWATSALKHGDTVTDNSATWTARAQRLPEPVEEAAIMLAVDWFSGGLSHPTGVSQESFEGAMIQYMGRQQALSGAVRALLEAYR